MTVVRELVAKFGLDFDSAKFENANQVVEFLKENMQAVATVAVGSAAVGIAYLARTAGQAAREVSLLAESFGLSANELVAWQTVAAGAGVEAEQFRTVLAAFARQVTAAGENPALGRIFRDLGVEAKDASGHMRSTSDVLRDTLVGLGRVQDPARRAALAMQLLGEQGARLLPAFADGSASLEDMQAAVEGLFGEDIEHAAEQSAKLDAELAKLDLSWTSIKTTIALEVLPYMTAFVRKVGEFFRPIVEAARGTNVLKIAFAALGIAALALGIKMLLPFLPAIATFLLIAAGIAAIILIVDDLIAMFTGGKSVIAEFIDELFGAGAAAEFVEKLKFAWNDIIRFWDEEGIPALKKAWNDIKHGVSDLVDWWSEKWATVKEVFTIAWNAVANFFTNTLPTAFDNAKIRASAFFDEVGIKIDEMIEKANAAASAVQAIGSGNFAQAADAASRFQAAGSIADVRRAVVRTTSAAQIAANVRQTTTVGQIVVQGSGDPEAVAEAVQTRIRETNARDLENARNALVRTAD